MMNKYFKGDIYIFFTCSYIQKMHHFPQTVHCCSSSFQPLPATLGFRSRLTLQVQKDCETFELRMLYKSTLWATVAVWKCLRMPSPTNSAQINLQQQNKPGSTMNVHSEDAIYIADTHCSGTQLNAKCVQHQLLRDWWFWYYVIIMKEQFPISLT